MKNALFIFIIFLYFSFSINLKVSLYPKYSSWMKLFTLETFLQKFWGIVVRRTKELNLTDCIRTLQFLFNRKKDWVKNVMMGWLTTKWIVGKIVLEEKISLKWSNERVVREKTHLLPLSSSFASQYVHSHVNNFYIFEMYLNHNLKKKTKREKKITRQQIISIENEMEIRWDHHGIIFSLLTYVYSKKR